MLCVKMELRREALVLTCEFFQADWVPMVQLQTVVNHGHLGSHMSQEE